MDKDKKQVSIDAKLHKRIKIFANVHDRTLTDFVAEAVSEKLEREEQGESGGSEKEKDKDDGGRV